MTMGALALDKEVRPILRRTFDTRLLNSLANHPAIRPACGGDGASFLDMAILVENHNNHIVVWDAGAFVFCWSAPHTYEVHAMILPEGRGRSAYRMARAGIGYIVAEGADRLWARVTKGADGLRHYTAQAGFTRCGSDTVDYGFGPVAYDLYQWTKPCR